MMPAPIRLRAALAGFLAFGAAMAALHFLNWGAQPRHMSNFVFQSGGWLWSLAILSITLGLASLASVLRELSPRDKDVRLGTALLWGAGATFLLLALFPTDPTDWPTTFGGYLHVLAAIASITLESSAMLVLVDAGRRDPRLGAVTGRSYAWPATIMGVGYLWGFSDGLEWAINPLVQRLMAVLMVGWLLLVTVRLQASLASQAAPASGEAAPAGR
ncbi:MAG TPA: DUF998 domain-containing protein [Candidatus Thermoplasmatota archaeon]|nr:DUF998 domain-containing protein [Candidatus Thermoplasmatota archaeon]